MPNSSALYFQGTALVLGGSVIRLGTKTNASGTSTYPAAGDTAISIKGANSAGALRHYQIWYRNAAAFCTPATFNLSNGLSLTWGA
jgi:hypothetical protein